MANQFPLVYHKLCFETARSLKHDQVGFCRSGSAGSAPYTAMVWGGDQTHDWSKQFGYPSSIVAGIS
ncbi:MAG: hypothetical protein M3Z92_00785 [Bacteroidota bacterium]|nr:hypothetical protein [Bacteroidota bacterium]